jgi:hypothetical protein
MERNHYVGDDDDDGGGGGCYYNEDNDNLLPLGYLWRSAIKYRDLPVSTKMTQNSHFHRSEL